VNDRVSDLMDLILIEDLTPDLDLDLADTNRACMAVFTNRSTTHPWPPAVSPSPQGELLWNALVTDTGFTSAGLADATHRVNALITEIDDTA